MSQPMMNMSDIHVLGTPLVIEIEGIIWKSPTVKK